MASQEREPGNHQSGQLSGAGRRVTVDAGLRAGSNRARVARPKKEDRGEEEGIFQAPAGHGRCELRDGRVRRGGCGCLERDGDGPAEADANVAWNISKVASQPTLTLAPGQTATENYTVTVGTTGLTDSSWAIDGTVSSDAEPGLFANEVDTLLTPPGFAGGSQTLSCGGIFPGLFDLSSPLSCPYHYDVPDATTRAVDGTVYTTTAGGNSGHATADFSSASVTPVDNCVTVTDSYAGMLGTVCAADGSHTYTYPWTIGPYTASQCGQAQVDNSAIVTNSNNDVLGQDDGPVIVTVQCPPPPSGCALTIGYWKNHAGFGPQADAVTPLLPILLGNGGGKSLNVTTAALAVQLLSFNGSNNVSASSNDINKLYGQLLGAKLDINSGASGAPVASIIAAADAFLTTHNSTDWAGLSKADKASVLAWADGLDNYNNGLAGVPHCNS